MKTTTTRNIKMFTFGIVIIPICMSSSIFGQKMQINSISPKIDHQQKENSSNLSMRADHPVSSDENKQPELSTKEVKENNSMPKLHHSALSTHKIFHHRTPATLSPDRLIKGNTYNRYGEKSNPKGYGIQVVTFKKIKNLQKFLHTYHKKDMYIQVIQFDTMHEQLYRVILGAEENKDLVEQEIAIFQNAGVQAVVRKHKDSE
jgi:hypothetical protein